MSLKFVQTPAVSLYSGMSAVATSAIITPYPVDLDGVKLTISDFGTSPTFTVDPKISGYEEIIGFTAITDNGDGTATLTGLTRDLQSKYPYTGTGTGKQHGSSAVVVFSDNPQVYGRLGAKENDEVLTGFWTAPDPVSMQGLATKAYVLSVVNGGAVSVDSVKLSGVAGETVVAGNVVYFKTSDQRWWKSSALTSSTFYQVKLGIISTGGIAGAGIVIQTEGIASGFSGRTPGAIQYLSDTGGAVSETTGTTTVFIGWAKDATNVIIDFQSIYSPTQLEKDFLTSYSAGIIGVPVPTFSKTAASGFTMLDGSALARVGQYARLFAVYCPSGTFTVTIASPGVFTKTGHGLIAGDRLHFTTTGGLPSGLSTATEYFVLSTSLTTDTFKVALSPEGTAVITSGSQSGVHTLYNHVGGMGDGSTTFNVVDMRAKGILGAGAGVQTLKFESAAVIFASDWVTIPNYIFPAQGQAVILTTTGTLPAGLSLATTYYIVRLTTTTIGFATSQANANAATLINITDAGSGVHTMTYTNVSDSRLGSMGGEETHAQAKTELAAHTHSLITGTAGVGNNIGYSAANSNVANTDASVGGDGQHNNLSPFVRANWMTKY